MSRNTVKPEPDAEIATTVQLGFDVAYKPIEAEFTWERGIESNEVGYMATPRPISRSAMP